MRKLCFCPDMWKNPEKQWQKQWYSQLITWDFLQNLLCSYHNFCLRNGAELDIDSNYKELTKE